MGHKVNAISFRLRKYWDSLYFINNSKILKNNILQDLFIKKYIERICIHQDQILLSLKIFRNSNSIILFLKLFYWRNYRNKFLRSKKKTKLLKYYTLKPLVSLENHLKQNIQNFFNIDNVLIYLVKTPSIKRILKVKIMRKLTYLKFNPYFKKCLKFIRASFEHNNVKLLSVGIAKAIEKNPKHLRILSFINKLLLVFFKNSKYISNLSIKKIKGYRIEVRGKFNGKPRAKKKIISKGPMPFSMIDANIKYSYTTAYTKYGNFGIKVWIFIQ